MLLVWRKISIICVVLCAVFLFGETVHAQAADESSVAQLTTDPLYPEPFGTVTISLEAYTMNTTGATILWYVDGVEQTSSRNERSMTLSMGALGQKKVVAVKVSQPNSFSISLTRTLIPSEVDLILEADTYIPAFYKGRALPSGQATVRAIAIPHLSSKLSPNEFTYEWKQGETVLFGGPVKGKYAADITMSRYDDDYIRVTVTDSTGGVVGGRAMFLTPTEPEIHFYEENPLRGLSSKAIVDSLYLIGDETTIHAEPFFMATDLSERSVEFNWSINGNPTVNPGHTLTLRRTGNGGSASVDLMALTTTQIPQYVQKGFMLKF